MRVALLPQDEAALVERLLALGLVLLVTDLTTGGVPTVADDPDGGRRD